MTDEIPAGDAELVIITYLRSALGLISPTPTYLQDIVVGRQYPKAADPGRFVKVTRSGGTMVNKVEDAPRIDFRVWHDGGAHPAMRAALRCRSLMYAARNQVVSSDHLGSVRVGQVTEFLGPGRFPDPLDDEREIIMFTLETRLRAT